MNIGRAERPAHTVTQLQPCQIFSFYLLYCQLHLFLLLLLFFTLPSNCLISALMHIAILIFMLFLSMLHDISTPVISGFGGMQLKIEMNPKERLYVFNMHRFFIFLPLAFFLLLFLKGLKYCIQSSNLFLDVAHHRFHNSLIVRF